jgi:hypothetical protein
VRTGCDECVDCLSVVNVRERSMLSVLVLRVLSVADASGRVC